MAVRTCNTCTGGPALDQVARARLGIMDACAFLGAGYKALDKSGMGVMEALTSDHLAAMQDLGEHILATVCRYQQIGEVLSAKPECRGDEGPCPKLQGVLSLLLINNN